MPELPEVESLRRQLEPNLTGRQIIAFELAMPRIVRSGDVRSLLGARITAVERKGKYLVIPSDRPAALFVHMGMTGTLLFQLEAGHERFIRATIRLQRGLVLFRDIRTLGGFWIATLDSPPWKNLAPDPLEPSFNLEYLSKALSHRKAPIKPLLLDQSVVSGIGNIYASEILFRAGIDPRTPAERLNARQVERLVELSRSVLLEAIESKGTTFRDFRLSDGRDGEFRQFLKVYGREGESCLKCGRKVVRIVQAQRSSYYCPACQKLPRARKGG